MNLFDKFILTLATGFGAGNLPKAPGTFGSLLGLPLGYLIAAHGGELQHRIIWLIAATVGGFLITQHAENLLGTHDDQSIVIDEVVGQALAIALFEPSLLLCAVGFGLFRLFDIWKPSLIGYIDENLPGAWGTFFDDILAGLAAAAVLWFFVYIGLLI
jgi:phosphatidylglycerophosphatase A